MSPSPTPLGQMGDICILLPFGVAERSLSLSHFRGPRGGLCPPHPIEVSILFPFRRPRGSPSSSFLGGLEFSPTSSHLGGWGVSVLLTFGGTVGGLHSPSPGERPWGGLCCLPLWGAQGVSILLTLGGTVGVPVLLRCGVSWESLSSSPNKGPGTGSLSSLPLWGPELVSVLLALGGSLSSSSLGVPGGHCTSYLWRNHNGLHPSSLWGEPGGSPSFSLLQWGQGGLHPPLLWGAQGVSVLLL